MNMCSSAEVAASFDVKKNISMAGYSTWKIGGNVSYLFTPKSLEDLQSFLPKVPDNQEIIFIGLGSNLLVRDAGVDACAIYTLKGLNKITLLSDNKIKAQAGVSCASLARFAARNNIEGLEFLAGVPGTVGGALAMNAGCHGSETWEYVRSVQMVDRSGDLYELSPQDFNIQYRKVSLQNTKYIINECFQHGSMRFSSKYDVFQEGSLELESSKQGAGLGLQGSHDSSIDRDNIDFYDKWFVGAIFEGSLGSKEKSLIKIKECLSQREKTQPIDMPNCGSVFANPPGDYAAKLIELCGLKGYTIGGARVSEKHANFIVHDGSASATDVENLIDYVQSKVFEITSVKLQPEVKIIGK